MAREESTPAKSRNGGEVRGEGSSQMAQGLVAILTSLDFTPS